MKKIIRFAIIGSIVSMILILVKTSLMSKILAASSLLVFLVILFGTYKKGYDHV
jgi:hypothetical protein